MTTQIDAELERQIGAHLDRGDQRAAVTVGLTGYAALLLADLRRWLGDREAARDLFGELARQLLEGIAGYRREASFLTWARTIGRHLARRQLRRRRRQVALDTGDFALAADQKLHTDPREERSVTSPYAKAEVGERMKAVRSKLGANAQELLAERFGGGGARPAKESKGEERAAARVRKQVSRTYQRLAVLLRTDGEERLGALLRELSPLARRLLALRQQEGRPWSEIAQSMRDEGLWSGEDSELVACFRAARAQLLESCRAQGLLPRELLDARLLSLEEQPAVVPSPRRGRRRAL